MLGMQKLQVGSMRVEDCLIFDRDIAALLAEEFAEVVAKTASERKMNKSEELLTAKVVSGIEEAANYRSVVIQVFDSSTVRVKLGEFSENRDDRWMHELLIVPWRCCIEKESVASGVPVVCFRSMAQNVLVMLDSRLELESNELSKNGHCCLLMSEEEYQELLSKSDALKDLVDDALTFGADIAKGTTSQEVDQNEESFSRFHQVLTTIYSKPDAVVVSVAPDAEEAWLKEILKRGHSTRAQRIEQFAEEMQDMMLHRYMNKS